MLLPSFRVASHHFREKLSSLEDQGILAGILVFNRMVLMKRKFSLGLENELAWKLGLSSNLARSRTHPCKRILLRRCS